MKRVPELEVFELHEFFGFTYHGVVWSVTNSDRSSFLGSLLGVAAGALAAGTPFP